MSPPLGQEGRVVAERFGAGGDVQHDVAPSFEGGQADGETHVEALLDRIVLVVSGVSTSLGAAGLTAAPPSTAPAAPTALTSLSVRCLILFIVVSMVATNPIDGLYRGFDQARCRPALEEGT